MDHQNHKEFETSLNGLNNKPDPTEEYEGLMSPSKEKNTTKDDLEFIKNVSALENGLCAVSKWTLVKVYFEMMLGGLMISGNIVGTVFQNTIGLVALSTKKLGFEQACFGIVCSIYVVYGYCLIVASQDKLGIELSKAFGMQCPQRVKAAFQRGLLSLLVLFFLIPLPIMYFSGFFLRLIDIKEENIDLCQQCLRICIPIYVIQNIEESFRTFCVAQGLEKYFGFVSFPNNILCCLLTYWMIVYQDMGCIGCLVSRLIYEVINLIASIVIYKCFSSKNYQGCISMKETLNGFKAYFCDNMMFVVGSYAEFIGYQSVLYFVTQLKDNDELAAYSDMGNLGSLIFAVGISIAVASRTRISVLIGVNLKKAAYNLYLFLCIAFFLTGALLVAFYPLYHDKIAEIYTYEGTPIRKHFRKLMFVYFFLYLPIEMSLYTALIGVKALGKMKILLGLNFFLILFCNILSLYVAIKLDYHSPVFLGILNFYMTVLGVAIFIISLRTDWTKEAHRIVDPKDAAAEEARKSLDNQDRAGMLNLGHDSEREYSGQGNNVYNDYESSQNN